MTKKEHREYRGILKDKSKRCGSRCYCGWHNGRERLHLKEQNKVNTRVAFKTMMNKVDNGIINVEDIVWTENQDYHTDKWDVC